MLDPKVPPGKSQTMPVPSPYWGDKLYWYDPAITNHAAMDGKGRVWMSSRFRLPENQPAFCATHPSAALAPQKTSFRQVQYFDPRTRQFKQVNICFDTHHVQFAADKDETLYGNGVFSGAIGWINTRILDETGDEAAAQGWCRAWHDLNQDGKVDPAVDRQIAVSVIYSVIPHPSDGSVWGAAPGPMPGKIIRIDPKTCVGEAYEPPFDPAAGIVGYTPRGIDVDSNGVIWTALASSGHLASFDRRKCKGPLQGPAATSGQHCREGWTLYPVPGPRFRGVRGDVAVDFQYYNFVDRFNTFGLGENVPFANGTNSDSLLALQQDGTWLVLRVPYPLGFFSRGMDGRIDDPKAGGRAARSTRTTAPTPCGTWKAASARAARSSSSSCGPIRWRSNRPMRLIPSLVSRIAASMLLAASALAYVDLAGGWAQRFHEDLPERGAGPTSATTSDCRSTTRRACGPTRGTPASGRCRSGSVSRTRRLRAAGPGEHAHREHRRSRVAGRHCLAHDDDVDAAAPHHPHGRPPASVRVRAAHLAGLLDR